MPDAHLWAVDAPASSHYWCMMYSIDNYINFDAWYTALSYIDVWYTALNHIDAWCTSMSHGCTALRHGSQYWTILMHDANHWGKLSHNWCMVQRYYWTIWCLMHSIELCCCLIEPALNASIECLIEQELSHWAIAWAMHWAEQFTFELGAHNAVVNSAHARAA